VQLTCCQSLPFCRERLHATVMLPTRCWAYQLLMDLPAIVVSVSALLSMSCEESSAERASQMCVTLVSVCPGILAALDTAGKEWAAAQRTCAQQMLVLESLLRDHGSDNSPQEELLRLLGSGSMSPAMNQFLSSTLGAPYRPSIACTQAHIHLCSVQQAA